VRTDPLIALIRERARLFKLAEDTRARAKKIESELSEDVGERRVRINFFEGFIKPAKFDFKTESDVKIFCEVVRKISFRDRRIPHWDRIVAQAIDDFPGGTNSDPRGPRGFRLRSA